MPFTCSTVVSMVNSGTISTIPPIAIVISVSTTMRTAFFSMVSWRMNIALVSRQNGAGRRHGHARPGGDALHGHDQVERHHQRAGQEHDAAEHANDEVGMHGDHALDERVLQ